jgi:hypothetical protein
MGQADYELRCEREYEAVTEERDTSLAKELAECTPNMWIEAITSLTARDCDEPQKLAIFSALSPDNVRLVAQSTGDAVLLMLLALNYPKQWAEVAMFRIADLVRDGDDFARWVELLDRRAA